MTDQRETLCYLCQNSNRNGCSWARSLEPVKGWDAEKNNQGYLVLWCPEFKKETPETILPKDLDRDGMMNLLEAMARQMREDYVNGTGKYTTNDLHKHSLKQEDFAKLRRMNREAFLSRIFAVFTSDLYPEQLRFLHLRPATGWITGHAVFASLQKTSMRSRCFWKPSGCAPLKSITPVLSAGS